MGVSSTVLGEMDLAYLVSDARASIMLAATCSQNVTMSGLNQILYTWTQKLMIADITDLDGHVLVKPKTLGSPLRYDMQRRILDRTWETRCLAAFQESPLLAQIVIS